MRTNVIPDYKVQRKIAYGVGLSPALNLLRDLIEDATCLNVSLEGQAKTP